MSEARTYRFADSSVPGILLGLRARQAVPVIAGVVWLAGCLQAPLGAPAGVAGLLVALVVAFGQWRGTPIAEALAPATAAGVASLTRRRRWQRPLVSAVGDATVAGDLPPALAGLRLVEAPADAAGMSGRAGRPTAVVIDDRRGLYTAALRVGGHGFALAPGEDQDRMLAMWGAALSPLARDRSPVTRVTWQAWSGTADPGGHHDYLTTSTAAAGGENDPALADYLALVTQQAPATRSPDVVVALTVDRHWAGRGRGAGRDEAVIEALGVEVARLVQRLDAGGLAGEALDAVTLAALVRIRSDPVRAPQVSTLARSLAAAAGRGRMGWGPMVVEPRWGHLRVDGSWHRSYLVAAWPQLPVPADWLGALLGEATATRALSVVMEPVPLTRSARHAGREAMARAAEADAKARRGFRATAVDRKRLARVEERERELSEGHAEFRFAGIVDVSAADLDALEDASAAIEQAAAQSLVDLRPLDGRHDQGWVACLPLGRGVRSPGGLR